MIISIQQVISLFWLTRREEEKFETKNGFVLGPAPETPKKEKKNVPYTLEMFVNWFCGVLEKVFFYEKLMTSLQYSVKL